MYALLMALNNAGYRIFSGLHCWFLEIYSASEPGLSHVEVVCVCVCVLACDYW